MRILYQYLNPGMGPFPRKEKSSIDYVDLGETSDEEKLIPHAERDITRWVQSGLTPVKIWSSVQRRACEIRRGTQPWICPQRGNSHGNHATSTCNRGIWPKGYAKHTSFDRNRLGTRVWPRTETERSKKNCSNWKMSGVWEVWKPDIVPRCAEFNRPTQEFIREG